MTAAIVIGLAKLIGALIGLGLAFLILHYIDL
jgi:hypothetical protein